MARAKKVVEELPEEAPKEKKKRIPRVVVSMSLSETLDFRLSMLAKSLRMRKNAFAEKILDQGCRGYKLDQMLQSASSDSMDEDEAAA